MERLDKPPEAESLFRRYVNQQVGLYERRVQVSREARIKNEERALERTEAERKLLEDAGIDVRVIEALNSKQKSDLDRWLAHTEPVEVESDPGETPNSLIEKSTSAFRQVPLVGTLALAPRVELLEHIEGER